MHHDLQQRVTDDVASLEPRMATKSFISCRCSREALLKHDRSRSSGLPNPVELLYYFPFVLRKQIGGEQVRADDGGVACHSIRRLAA